MTDKLTKDLTPQEMLATILSRMDKLEDRFSALEQRVEDRLHDTRPIWAAVQAQLETQQRQLTEIKEQLNRHDQSFDRLESIMEVLNEDLMNFRGRHRQLEKRVTELEKAA